MPMERIISEPSAVSSQQSATEEQILTDAGFFWREADGVKVLVSRALEDAGFVNGFSTRLGGVSPFPHGDLNLAGFNEDSRENIYENRRRFLRLFDGEFKLAVAWQVHGDNILVVERQSDVRDSDENADAVISNIDGVLAGVKTADCVPVIIGDPMTNAFAAVHAGWRGTAQGIVKKTIIELSKRFGVRPTDIVAAIGPAAGKCSYEIGQEVIDAFADLDPSSKYFTPTREGHALVDLHAANRDQLIDAGVDETNIYTAPFDTMERTDLFFSYRREKIKNGKTGRLLSVIGRR